MSAVFPHWRKMLVTIALLALMIVAVGLGCGVSERASVQAPAHPRVGLSPHACEPGPLSAATCGR